MPMATLLLMTPHRMMLGAYSFSVLRMCVRGYMRTNLRPSVRMCVCTNVHTYVSDPVILRLRHLYQVEFCSFILRYPTTGASVYCGHNSSFSFVCVCVCVCAFVCVCVFQKIATVALILSPAS